MSCEYCTPWFHPDTGESLEFCKEFIYVDKGHQNTIIRTCLIQDSYDGSWLRQVLMADEWPERKGAANFPVTTIYEAPPFCPHCGRELPKAKWLWRLEAKEPEHGLWYDGDGRMVWDVGKLDCSTKDLPMEYDWRYRQDGKSWWSSCSDKADLTHWYSVEDARRLLDNGFVFTRYLATDYHEYEQETVFLKETSLRREELSLEEVFGHEHAAEL